MWGFFFVFCEVHSGIMRINIHDVRCSSPLPEEMVLTVSVSTARRSKFSHLLRLADNFWWCFVPDGGLLSERGRAGKCICNYVFAVSSSSYTPLLLVSFLSSFYFEHLYHSLGPLLGEKHWIKDGLMRLCVRAFAEATWGSIAGADVVHLLKNRSTRREQRRYRVEIVIGQVRLLSAKIFL